MEWRGCGMLPPRSLFSMPGNSTSVSAVIRFGPFDADLQAQELRKHGVRLRLPGQSFQILKMLLERPGNLVSREELQKALWPSDTFVDFDHSLNAAVNRLRETLGDSADDPSLIETLPRRGYRFIGTIDVPPNVNGNDLRIASPLPEIAAEAPVVAGASANAWRLWRTLAAVAVLLLICAAIWYSQPRPPTVTNAVRITNDKKAKSSLQAPVTDGVHLYFVEGLPSTTGSGIAQLSARGGETTWITTTLQQVLAIYGISPDRSELLVPNGVPVGSRLSAAELWVQPLPSGAPHRVGNIIAEAACWTPDGMHIVYAYEHAIMITNKDGTEPHQLAKVPDVVRALRFSPDGRRIRFSVLPFAGADSSSILEMDANGKDIHPLFPDWKESPYTCCGDWSPDGAYYYFQAGRGDAQAIWVMPERRSIFRRAEAGPSRLTSGPLRFSVPVPSSDGKRLFVVGEEPRVELLRYDLRARRFDPYLQGLSAGLVAFSPDRKWMAYVSYPDMTLWRSRMDGSDKMQLTFPPVRAYAPRWSPDGSKIVFMDAQFYHPWKSRLISSSGGSPELLVQGGTDDAEADGDPTWTPDGKSVVFGKFDANRNVAIYRLDLKTRKVSSIPDSDGIFSPRVSPDGRYISALAKDLTKLMLFDASTNRWSSLVEGEQVGYNEWSPDGKYVYMRETWGGAGELVRVRITDRVLEHVLSFKDFPQPNDLFTAWIGLAPDGAPLLMRDRSVQEIYALDLRFH
jgi:Tol biopolymer transport system component/DNA-binding winged helix-turn-helix (wHTH) protein